MTSFSKSIADDVIVSQGFSINGASYCPVAHHQRAMKMIRFDSSNMKKWKSEITRSCRGLF